MPGIRRRVVDAVRAGIEAGRDADTLPTACPYPITAAVERRAWVRGFGRGRVLAKIPAPSEVGESVDDTAADG